MGRFLDMAGANSTPQCICITGKISGKDILLTNERAPSKNPREKLWSMAAMISISEFYDIDGL